jgi:hypothetical protein
MFGARGAQFGQAAGSQLATKSKDELERERVAKTINDEYAATKLAVEGHLNGLDKSVGDYFDKEAERHRDNFKRNLDQGIANYRIDRYESSNIAVGAALFIKDEVVGLPSEVEAIYVKWRNRYLEDMDTLIDEVARRVEKALTAAALRIKTGKTTIKTFVDSLPKNLREFGQQAADEINLKFDELSQQVNEKRDQLIERLATKYVETLKEVDQFIEEKKKENRGLAAAAMEFIDGVIEALKKIRDMLLNILAKVAEAIDLILDDPIGFLGNLIGAVKKGLFQFIDNIGKHLLNGLMGWLFGALADAGIELPKSFDLRGIFGMILQVLGLTYRNIRSRAVKIVGEKVVSALETAAEVFIILVNEGPAGLIKFLKDKFEELKESMMEQIRNFVIERVVVAGIKWILGLLNPAGAFIKACMAIYDIVMFFINNGSRILALVNAVVDSILDIAKGNIAGAANWIEGALAKAVPIAISFLASLLGLDGIGQKVKSIIEKIQAPVNAAIDFLIKGAVKVVQAAGKLLSGAFGGKKSEEKPPALDDPQGVKAAALARLHAEGAHKMTVPALRTLVARIHGDLRTQGLKRLYVAAQDEDGKYPIRAEASADQALLTAVPLGTIVSMEAKIGLDAPAPASVTRDVPFSAATGQTLQQINDQRGSSNRAMPKAQGGFGFVASRTDDEIFVATWNTGTAGRRGGNNSHAEAQLDRFIRARGQTWIGNIRSIRMTINKSPCTRCAPMLDRLATEINVRRGSKPALAKSDLVITADERYHDPGTPACWALNVRGEPKPEEVEAL